MYGYAFQRRSIVSLAIQFSEPGPLVFVIYVIISFNVIRTDDPPLFYNVIRIFYILCPGVPCSFIAEVFQKLDQRIDGIIRGKNSESLGKGTPYPKRGLEFKVKTSPLA